MKKNLISIIVFAVLLCPVMPAAGFTDTAGLNCDEAVRVLSALNIIEGKSEERFEPEASITRAEMATILVRVMGIESTVSGTDIFKDVPSSHFAYGNIAAAYQLGLIKGFDKDNFAPDEPVTYPQAVKMIVCTLGYEIKAENAGGYPVGYFAVASKLGILKGVSSGDDFAISRGSTAIILYNALEVPLLEKTAYGPGAYTYEELSDVTLLSKYMKVYTVKGRITANYYSSIKNSQSNITKGNIAIEGAVYSAGGTNAEEMIGRKVKAYYNYPDGAGTPVLLIAAPSPGSDILTVRAEDITADTTKTKLTYCQEDHARDIEAEIYSGAILVFNGKVKADWTSSDLMPKAGSVTLIRNDGKAADTVFVWSYTNYVVSSKDEDECLVYFKASVNGVNSMVIDSESTAVKSELIDKTGAKFTIADINEWDILSAAQSEDCKVLRIVKSSDVISGEVTEVSEDEVVIGGAKYTVASSLPNGTLKAPELKMNAEYRLDFMGNIAAVNTEYESGYKYGFLVGTENKDGIEKYARFKVFTEDGKMEVYEAANRISVNGVTYSKTSVIDNFPMKTIYNENVKPYSSSGTPKQIYGASGTTVRQLIKYQTNSEGTKITEILTASNRTEEPENYAGIEGFNMIWELDKNNRALTPYKDDQKAVTDVRTYQYIGGSVASFASRFLMRKTTKIFFIPDENAADDKYSVKTVTGITHSNYYTNMSLYDLDENYVVGAMVWDRGSTGEELEYPLNYTAPVGIVTGMSNGIDENGENTVNIRLYTWNGDDTTLWAEKGFECGYKLVNTDMTKDPYADSLMKDSDGKVVTSRVNSGAKISISELKTGDIIQYNSTENKFTLISVLYRAATPGMYENGANGGSWLTSSKYSNYLGGNLISNGIVKSVGEFSIVGETYMTDYLGKKGNELVTRGYPVTGRMIVVDVGKETYRTITYENLMPNDTYVSLWRTTTQMMFIVYRNYL